MVREFNFPLSEMDRSSRQKINKETIKLNCTIDQMDLTDIYRIFHPLAAKCTFFSSIYRTLSMIDLMVDQNQNLNF
jgi:hypothetical protein